MVINLIYNILCYNPLPFHKETNHVLNKIWFVLWPRTDDGIENVSVLNILKTTVGASWVHTNVLYCYTVLFHGMATFEDE